jgi:single-stranded-DNA-specific exonuclease
LSHWILSEPAQPETVQHLIDALGVPAVIARILFNRGIRTQEEARRFFEPVWGDLHDPFLMKDMHRAVDRIVRALEGGERIMIYGDYDVDGITSVSLMYLFLKKRGANVFFYIPDRLREGYGLSEAGIRKAAAEGATLLITVDCGITGVEEILTARRLGMDVIVTDHHEQGKELPKAFAILNPKRVDCPYPFKELAGVGVAFKLAQAAAVRLGLEEETAREFIDLVALGSAADIVPMIDENRVLVTLGMEKVNRLDRHGIAALAESSGLAGKPIGTGQVVFVLAPRINAVGRLGDAERAVQLLITESPAQAGEIACVLESENRNRKNLDDETFLEAKGIVDADPALPGSKAVVLWRDGWHPGVIGIVASRIVEKCCRPTVMIAVDGDIGKGSARSVPGFDIYTALKDCEDLLLSFGGHRHAAGLTIRAERLAEFRERFGVLAAERIREEDLVPRVWVDAEISLPEINDAFMQLINRFAPFGPQNMRPVFLSRNLMVVGSPRIVGKNHLKFKVRQKGEVFDAIGFDLGDLLYRLTPGEGNLDMVFVVEENHWNNETRIQLRVKDVK